MNKHIITFLSLVALIGCPANASEQSITQLSSNQSNEDNDIFKNHVGYEDAVKEICVRENLFSSIDNNFTYGVFKDIINAAIGEHKNFSVKNAIRSRLQNGTAFQTYFEKECEILVNPGNLKVTLFHSGLNKKFTKENIESYLSELLASRVHNKLGVLREAIISANLNEKSYKEKDVEENLK